MTQGTWGQVQQGNGWDDTWEDLHSPTSAQITTDNRMTVQHFHYPPPAPPPPPAPQIVYMAPPPKPPKVDDLVLAGGVFAVGVILIAVVTGFSAIWFGIVAVFLGIVALISGFALFISWTDRFSRCRR
jgi:hypothetical protein